MSRELSEHRSYIADDAKIHAYRRALAEVITPDSVVVDLGCGTGLLGLLACQAGAKKVYGIDSGDIIELARRVAADNGFADRITYIRGSSTDVQLPELADVVIADQIGGLAYSAGVLHFYEDARRFLKPSGVFVPASFDLQLAPMSAPELWSKVNDWQSCRPGGLSFASGLRHAINSVWSERVSADTKLGPSVTFTTIRSDVAERIQGSARLTIEVPGTCHGLLGTFVAHMAPGVTMTNDPADPARMRHRWQDQMFLPTPIDVVPGDVIEAEFSALPAQSIASWRCVALRGDTVLARGGANTFTGAFLTTEGVRNKLARTDVLGGSRVEAARWLLAQPKAGLTPPEAAQLLIREFPDSFASDRSAIRFVERLEVVLRDVQV